MPLFNYSEFGTLLESLEKMEFEPTLKRVGVILQLSGPYRIALRSNFDCEISPTKLASGLGFFAFGCCDNLRAVFRIRDLPSW